MGLEMRKTLPMHVGGLGSIGSQAPHMHRWAPGSDQLAGPLFNKLSKGGLGGSGGLGHPRFFKILPPI